MSKDNPRILFGQRVSLKTFCSSEIIDSDCLLLEMDISRETNVCTLFDLVADIQKSVLNTVIIPTFLFDSSFLLESPSTCNEVIKFHWGRCKNTKMVFAIDDDNSLIKAISPRSKDDENRERLLFALDQVISTGSIDGECLVALTIEELCPGGLDPTMGIALAKRFVSSGASCIIASGGTDDFPHLKHRRKTKMKSEISQVNTMYPEMFISSACWLLSQVGVPVMAQGQVDNPGNCVVWAQHLGLRGIISTSVKYPSSNLSMVNTIESR